MNKLIATLLLSILPLANAAEDLVFEYTPQVKQEKKETKKKKAKKKKAKKTKKDINDESLENEFKELHMKNMRKTLSYVGYILNDIIENNGRIYSKGVQGFYINQKTNDIFIRHDTIEWRLGDREPDYWTRGHISTYILDEDEAGAKCVEVLESREKYGEALDVNTYFSIRKIILVYPSKSHSLPLCYTTISGDEYAGGARLKNVYEKYRKSEQLAIEKIIKQGLFDAWICIEVESVYPHRFYWVRASELFDLYKKQN